MNFKNLPVAYLLDDGELNTDETNHWIFSEAGLRRLLKKTNWDVLRYGTVGAGGASSLDRDQRAFCYVRSRYGLANVNLQHGWHRAEGSGWRWTERVFGFEVPAAARVVMKFYLPDALTGSPLGLAVSVDRGPWTEERFDKAGEHRHVVALNGSKPHNLEYRLDRVLPADDSDGRERGIVVFGIDVEQDSRQ